MFSNPVDQFHHFKIQPNLIDVGTRLWGIKTHKLYSSEPCTEVYCFRLNFKILTSPSSLHVAPPLPPQDLSSCTPFFLFYVLKESSKISPHSTPPPQKKRHCILLYSMHCLVLLNQRKFKLRKNWSGSAGIYIISYIMSPVFVLLFVRNSTIKFTSQECCDTFLYCGNSTYIEILLHLCNSLPKNNTNKHDNNW